jgi:indolepyruvate decarboxylase
MLDGKFNDVAPWQFARLPDLFGAGKGFTVRTEAELAEALQAARLYTEGFCILDVQLGQYDFSPVLQRMTGAMGKNVK